MTTKNTIRIKPVKYDAYVEARISDKIIMFDHKGYVKAVRPYITQLECDKGEMIKTLTFLISKRDAAFFDKECCMLAVEEILTKITT